MSQEKLNQYSHAMAIDATTGKPMPKMAIAGAEGATGALPVNIKQSDIMQPVDIQSRFAQTVQTHSSSIVAPGAWNTGAFINTIGFDEVGITMVNDAVANSQMLVQWSNDGVNIQGEVSALPTSTSRFRATNLKTMAMFLRISIKNEDAAPRTISSWVYLKA